MNIGEALPAIFERPYTILQPGTDMLLAASLLSFHQIDALPIGFRSRQKKRFAVGGYSFLLSLEKTSPKKCGKFLSLPCERVSIELSTIKAEDTLENLLILFKKTRFGFAWVESESNGMEGLAGLRDLLELYEDGLIKTKMEVNRLASPIFSMPKDSTLKIVLKEMFSRGIRRVFVSGEGSFVTDRRIISYIFSTSRLSETMKKPETMLDGRLGDIEGTKPEPIDSKTSIKEAASYMKNSVEECLICDKGIVTPWDLIVKPLISKNLVFKEKV